MTKFIGRRFNVGFGKESVRGTGVASTFWAPSVEVSFDDKIEQIKDESTIGVIENQIDADIVKKYSEGSMSGIINDDVFGLILLGTFGTVNTTGPVSSLYTHTFSVAQSAQHQSLTFNVSEPNASGASSLRYSLGVIQSLDLSFANGAYPTFSFGFSANIGTATTSTVAYTQPDVFKPSQGVIRFATTYAGLASGTSYSVRSCDISITKNTEDDHNIGSQAVTDRLNKEFMCTGSFEMVYDSREFIDTLMLGNVARAMMIKFTNTDKTIGVANPTISFKFAKVKFQEVAKNISKGDIVMQTVNFEAFYSMSDSKMVDVIMENDVASY